MADQPALAVEDVVAGYGGVLALRGVSLSVRPGTITAVLGANGAGKTTLLTTISGFVRPRQGRITLEGADLTRRRPEEIARAGLAHVPEGQGVITELTVEENLRLAGNGDLSPAYDLFPVVHEFRKRQAGALSGGQQQQLAIARGLVARPDVLLLDEPSLGLAPQVVDLVFGALQEIRASGLAILLVEQRAQRTVALADRSHVLSNGRLRLTLGPEAANDSETLVAAYFS